VSVTTFEINVPGPGDEPVAVSATLRVTLSPAEAAASLGVSRDFFDEHVRDELRLIRRGRLVLVPVTELERWVDQNAARVIER
jgi:excisionase family DNA binding protein